MLVQPPITIPAGVDPSQVSIESDGTVQAGSQKLGKLSLVDVPAPDGLVADGDSVFSATAASGAIRAAKGASLQQGALEGSNVNMGERDEQDDGRPAAVLDGQPGDPVPGSDAPDRERDQAMSILSASGAQLYDPSLTSSNLPPVDAANEPADIRNGNTAAKKAYQEALGFEDILVQQLTQELASTVTSPSDDSSSGDGSDDSSSDSSGGILGLGPEHQRVRQPDPDRAHPEHHVERGPRDRAAARAGDRSCDRHAPG